MSILKPEIGAPVVLTVTGCRSVKGKFRQEYEFGGEDGVVYLGVDAADRQLARLKLTPDTVIGRTLEFSKVEKDGKKFTDINFASGAKGNGTGGASNGAAATTQPAATTQARPVTRQQVEQAFDAEPVEKEKASAIYKRMTQYVLSEIMPLYEANGMRPTANDVHAMVSTLFINVQGRR